MNSQDIKNKIESIGNIKVIFEPKTYQKDRIQKNDLQGILEKSQVSLRGWNFPHIPLADRDNTKRPYSIGDGIEFYTDWEKFIEIFRFYQSGQFLAKFALYEDRISSLHDRVLKPGEYLDFLSLIYKITEVVLFIKNVIENTNIEGGVLTIEINKTKDRELESIFSSRIISFNAGYICRIEKIETVIEFEREKIINENLEISMALIKNIFDDFNWKNYSEKMIRNHQENLLNRRI
jgi:hypothetical protein